MKSLGHLLIEEIKLSAGKEWSDADAAWRFVRIHTGAAYWLGAGQSRPLAEGEMLVAAPGAKGVVRASQISDVVLHAFNFAPDLLCGFFTLTERHFFETDAAAARDEVQFLPSTHPVAQKFSEVASRYAKHPGISQRADVLSLVAAAFDTKMSRHRPPTAISTSALHRFNQLITQMPEIEIINHPPEHLARLCACSPRHFNRLFLKQFGTSARSRQTELRLLKARQLLGSTDAKIIHVALESGYRNLSLFNSLFKKRFNMTPSEWRRKSTKKAGKIGRLAAAWAVLFLSAATPLFAAEANADTEAILRAREALRQKIAELAGQERGTGAVAVPTSHLVSAPPKLVEPEPAARARAALREKMAELDAPTNPTNAFPAHAVSTNETAFAVNGFDVLGNTLLPTEVIDSVLQRQIGPAVTFRSIRQGLADLQMAYRDRGFITVSVGLPQQQLTNGIVKVQVTEGRLAEVTLRGNRYFSSNNILRALPAARTNALLNGLVFQQQLDRANVNRDRQVYPIISPGPEPGTSALELKVKDRLPLHARLQLNNYSTPGTPEMRMNLSALYNNLWQLDHQFGVQYSFTPEALKKSTYPSATNRVASAYDFIHDEPLIASYSAFYRMPLSPVNGPPHDYAISDFGYDEVTHRFRAPPVNAAGELLFYASRSYSDSGRQQSSHTVNPTNDFTHAPPNSSPGGLQISDTIFSRTLSPNENLGMRLSKPLPGLDNIKSSISAGLDFKNFRSTLIQDRTFQATLFVPATGTNGPPFTQFPSPPTSATNLVFTSVQYLPFTLSFDASETDRHGSTAFNLSQSFNIAGLFSGAGDFRTVTGSTITHSTNVVNGTTNVVNSSTRVDGNYYVLTAGLTREQRIFGTWGLRLHADGQWASQPLVSNEQFGLGGASGVRGYRDGEEYGDAGWRASIEPHSPYVNLGLVDNTAPMFARLYTFLDYGQLYLIEPRGRDGSVSMMGAGLGVDATIGDHFEFRFSLGVPLLDVPKRKAGDVRVSFSIVAQF